jgi:hypothetical protein
MRIGPVLVAFALACSLAASATHAAPQHRTVTWDCEGSLTIVEAADAMGNTFAVPIRHSTEGGTSDCIWFGYEPGSKLPGHGLEVLVGPYKDFLTSKLLDRPTICSLSPAACRYLKQAQKAAAKPAVSFRAVIKMLDALGVARLLPADVFEGNLAVIWNPDEATAKLLRGGETRVFVYHGSTELLLDVVCTRLVGGTRSDVDNPCAIAGARRAYFNLF